MWQYRAMQASREPTNSVCRGAGAEEGGRGERPAGNHSACPAGVPGPPWPAPPGCRPPAPPTTAPGRCRCSIEGGRREGVCGACLAGRAARRWPTAQRWGHRWWPVAAAAGWPLRPAGTTHQVYCSSTTSGMSRPMRPMRHLCTQPASPHRGAACLSMASAPAPARGASAACAACTACTARRERTRRQEDGQYNQHGKQVPSGPPAAAYWASWQGGAGRQARLPWVGSSAGRSLPRAPRLWSSRCRPPGATPLRGGVVRGG